MSYIKDVGLPRHAWDTPPFLLIVSPTPPIQSVDAYVRTYVRTLGQSRDNQKKRGWPYSMSMGLCPTRASRAREPRYNYKMVLGNSQYFEDCFRGRWKSFAYLVPVFWKNGRVTRQLHPTAIHLRLATSVWRERSLTMTALPLFANSGKRLLWLLENGLITQHWALRSLARVLHACISTIPKTRQKDFRNLKQFQNLVLNIWTALK